MAELEPTFTRRYFLTPGECNAQQRMPLTLLLERVIEVATLHANRLGIGYDELIQHNQTWVLSRVALEMRRYPGVGQDYELTTWITTVNRLFSERDFEIRDGQGEVIGWARTLWAVLDRDSRAAGDISRLAWVARVIPPGREALTDKPERIREGNLHWEEAARYRFTFCDIDFNRHVNSARYVELLLNQWSLQWHDKNRLTRFDINYLHEAVYGQEAQVRLCPDDHHEGRTYAQLRVADTTICNAALTFTPR